MTSSGGAGVLALAGLLGLGGCATTSVTQQVEGVGPVGERLLVKRERTILVSSPWSGAAVKVEPPEYFLCRAEEAGRVRCEPASVELPPSR